MEDILNTHFETIHKIGYQIFDLPMDVFNIVRAETNEMELTGFANCIPHNKYLSGNIEREYTIVKSVPHIKRVLEKAVVQYYHSYKINISPNIKLTSEQDSVWVNFQKKHEFNPLHKHIGTLSYVIFVKIPYYTADENKNKSSKDSGSPLAGTFNFHYLDQYSYGGINSYTIPVDRTYEGKMILFSAGLTHSVFPFYTSDEYRVTVSGNIFL
jgi:hypothetical protein